MLTTLSLIFSGVFAVSVYAGSGPGTSVTPHSMIPGASAPFAGATVYDNGDADINTDSGNELTQWIQADDFELALSTEIAGAEFDWFTFVGLSWTGVVNWYVYLDNAGSPGAVHASGSGSSIVTNPLGHTTWVWYNTCFDFGQVVTVNAGQRYWLGLHLSNDCLARDDLYWGYSANQNFNFSQETLECVAPWANIALEDRAFSLKAQSTTGTSQAQWGQIKEMFR